MFCFALFPLCSCLFLLRPPFRSCLSGHSNFLSVGHVRFLQHCARRRRLSSAINPTCTLVARAGRCVDTFGWFLRRHNSRLRHLSKSARIRRNCFPYRWAFPRRINPRGCSQPPSCSSPRHAGAPGAWSRRTLFLYSNAQCQMTRNMQERCTWSLRCAPSKLESECSEVHVLSWTGADSHTL